MTIYINFAELPSWLMLAPLKNLCAEVKVDLAWKPMLSSLGNVAGSNLKPGEDDPLAIYKARRADARHKAATRENERMCGMLGIKPGQGERKINPLYLSLGMAWLTNQGAELQQYLSYVETAFLKTFRDGADVESLSSLKVVLEESGFRTAGLDHFVENEAPDLEAAGEEIMDSGVFNAPAFVVDGEIFHGREHLPLIQWMLAGKQGLPPV
ncbi:MAG: DsbA family protein [Pseudomonadales bacterium]|jgi:2-hydroxychromene-2-carboxylate isomerase